GSGATAGGTPGTYPGTGTSGMFQGAVPASTSVAHEGAGTEVVATATYSSSVLVPGSAATYMPTGQTPAWAEGAPGGPVITVGDEGSYTTAPNQTHASSLSPPYANNPTLTSLGTPSSVSGAGTVSQTVTGTGFTRQSVIYVNGVAQTTTFTSATSLTAP